MVGSSPGSKTTAALSASGVSRAMTRAWYMRAMRSQYSASSMKWVVTRMVTPLRTSPLMWVQNSRRVRGSTPEVGSSR